MPQLTPGFRYGSGLGRGGRGFVVVNGAVVAKLLGVPPAVHREATRGAAAAAAREIGGKGSGALARSVRQPKARGPLVSLIGSDLIYARIQNTGGVIRAKGTPLAIHAGAGGTGARVASAQQVRIPGKHYLQVAPPTYVALMMAGLKGGYAAAGV